MSYWSSYSDESRNANLQIVIPAEAGIYAQGFHPKQKDALGVPLFSPVADY